MFSSEENELAALSTALEHARSWVQLHTTQRQNLLNFFLIAVAFLFNAYVGALSVHRFLLAAVIAALGSIISVGFSLMDLRNRELTRAGEIPLIEIERRMAIKCRLPDLTIIETVDRPHYPWLSMGKIMRAIEIAAALVFLGSMAYAFSQ